MKKNINEGATVDAKRNLVSTQLNSLLRNAGVPIGADGQLDMSQITAEKQPYTNTVNGKTTTGETTVYKVNGKTLSQADLYSINKVLKGDVGSRNGISSLNTILPKLGIENIKATRSGLIDTTSNTFVNGNTQAQGDAQTQNAQPQIDPNIQQNAARFVKQMPYIKQVQKALNLPADGIFGPKTAQAIQNMLGQNNQAAAQEKAQQERMQQNKQNLQPISQPNNSLLASAPKAEIGNNNTGLAENIQKFNSLLERMDKVKKEGSILL